MEGKTSEGSQIFHLETEVTCKDEIPEPKVEVITFYEALEMEDQNNKEFTDEFDLSSQDCYGEEEWLIEELEQFTQETNTASSSDMRDALASDSYLKEEVCEELDDSNIREEVKNVPANLTCKKENNQQFKANCLIFEDKELSQGDMYICDVCQRVFGNQYKLESHHYRMHKQKKTPKKKGRKPKVSRSKEEWPPNVQELARRVNGVKTFFCKFCSYTVTRCDSMNKHILRVHSEGRVLPQHQCEVCGKVFIDKAYLRNHKVSHVTDKHHKCEICGRSFHRQPSLKRHLQSHSDDKQFSCKLCDYKTNRKHLMYKHVEHHKSGRAYTCRYCGLSLYTQLSFRSHIYTHNITPNSCSFCKVGFSSRERMFCHMRKVHFACEVKDLKDVKDFNSFEELKVTLYQ